MVWSPEVILLDDCCICLDIINLSDNSQRIKYELEESIDLIKKQISYLSRQVNDYNATLKSFVNQSFLTKKEYWIRNKNILVSLGVPIVKRENVSQTFAIPTPQTRKKIHVSRPAVAEKEYRPEPTLKDSDYQDILQYVHDVTIEGIQQGFEELNSDRTRPIEDFVQKMSL